MPSAALTLLGNADGDARVNDDSICDPLQGSLTIGEVTPVIFRGDLQALAPKEAISACIACCTGRTAHFRSGPYDPHRPSTTDAIMSDGLAGCWSFMLGRD
jgi:hypothetical protein